MYGREESGYGSNGSQADISPPLPDMCRIARDALRLSDEFCVSELMMNSANGVLYRGFSLVSGAEVVFKQIPRLSVPEWAELDGALVPAEIAHHFRAYAAAHSLDVVCRPITWLEKKSSFVLVLEKVENCLDLFELSRKYGALKEEPVRIIAAQLLRMWQSLNQSGIAHRDLKDENIIINSATLECRLIDFGCATLLSPKTQKSFAGTPEFYPPEWFRTGTYHHQSLTAWSVGVILFILLTGHMPTQSKGNLLEFELDRDARPLISTLSLEAQILLRALLDQNPATRADLKRANSLFDKWCC